MKTKQSHTSLPWKIWEDTRKETHIPYFETCITYDSDGGKIVARINDSSGEVEENAAFIIRACNSYYELLEACKELIEKSGDLYYDLVVEKSKKIILKAEGQEAGK